MSQPLKGIRVLDCSNLLPGPYCTMMLQAMGAQVIKLEPPGGGDFLRRMLPACFEFLNRGKQSIALNLKDEKGREIVYRLVKTVDVMIEGFRPGVAARLGIDFEKIKSINPGIIYVSISGYGQDGPYVRYPGHDIDYQAVSGLVSLNGDPDQERGFPVAFQASDIAGGIFALIATLAALVGKKTQDADSTGALYLDISMTDGLITWMLPRIVEYFEEGAPPRAEFMARGSYGVFKCKDGKYLSLGVVEEHFWERLCNLMGFRELLADDELRSWKGRNRNHARIIPRLEAAFLEKDRDEWLQLLRERDIPSAPVNEIKDLLKDPQVRHRKMLGVDDEGRFSPLLTSPFPVSALVDWSSLGSPPKVGEHGEDILKSLGYTEEEIKLMRDKGVIG